MNDLIEFLLARIAEDEAVASAIRDEHEMWDWDSYMSSAGTYGGTAHTFALRFDPARVLTECAVKRTLITVTRRWMDTGHITLDVQLRHLALPYAEHPDYDERWRP